MPISLEEYKDLEGFNGMSSKDNEGKLPCDTALATAAADVILYALRREVNNTLVSPGILEGHGSKVLGTQVRCLMQSTLDIVTFMTEKLVVLIGDRDTTVKALDLLYDHLEEYFGKAIGALINDVD